MNPSTHIAPLVLLLGIACGAAVPTAAPPSGPGTGSRPEHVADCGAAVDGLALGDGEPSVMHAAYEAPTSPAERDKNVAVLDAAIARWSSARGALDHAEVRDAADWVVEQMKKRRTTLLAMQFTKAAPSSDPEAPAYDVDKSDFVKGRDPWFDSIKILDTWCQDLRPVG